jgi:hypothetical protein
MAGINIICWLSPDQPIKCSNTESNEKVG